MTIQKETVQSDYWGINTVIEKPKSEYNISCVYAMIIDDRWIYIGSTKNLRTRTCDWKSILFGPIECVETMRSIARKSKSIKFEIVEEIMNLVWLRKAEFEYIALLVKQLGEDRNRLLNRNLKRRDKYTLSSTDEPIPYTTTPDGKNDGKLYFASLLNMREKIVENLIVEEGHPCNKYYYMQKLNMEF